MPRHFGLKHLASVLGASLLVAGCGSGGNFTYQEYTKVVSQSFHNMFNHADVSRETAASIPYSSMGYRLNDGDQAILVLATKTETSELWTASSHVVFQTAQGQITRTVGLAHDLGGLVPQQGEALIPPSAALQSPFTSTRLADFPQSSAYGVPIVCSAAPRQAETIVILGQSIATMRVDEACESRSLNWRYVDSYWMDPKSGFVWRSRQHLAPGDETVETEIFRPPG